MSVAYSLVVLVDSQVALGKPNELLQADNHANKLPKGLSSVIGLGSVGPNMKNAVTLSV